MRSFLKKLFSFLFRIDVFNRVIVFLSMVFFLIIPSYALYSIDDNNVDINVFMPCLILLSSLLGTGLFALYKPLKIPVFYFLEILVILLVFRNDFLYISVIDSRINLLAIFIIEVSYCSLGFFVNAILLFKYNFSHNKKLVFKELTNADTLYDFLNGSKVNKNIEEDIEKISDTTDMKYNFMPLLKKLKLSRFMRIISFIASYIASIYYLTVIGSAGNITNNLLFPVLLLNMIISPVLIFFAFIYPRDFRYVYFYNVCLFEFCGILCCKFLKISPLMFIIVLAFTVLSLLVALITEGRTWRGADPDEQ